jgi:hypothetical protein
MIIKVLEVVLYVGSGWFVWDVVGTSNLHYIGHNSIKNKGSIPLQVCFSRCVHYEKLCSLKPHYLTTKTQKNNSYTTIVQLSIRYDN